MHRLLWIVLVVGVGGAVACKKDSKDSGAGSAAPTPAAKTADTPAARPAVVTDAQVAATDKLLGEVESLGKDIAAANKDCDKIALAMKAHDEALKAGDAAMTAAKLDTADAAVTAYFKATYAARLSASAASYAAASASCATNEAYVHAVKAWSDSGAAGQLTLAMGITEGFDLYARKELEKAAKDIDAAGKEIDKAGKEIDKAGDEIDKANKEIDKAMGK